MNKILLTMLILAFALSGCRNDSNKVISTEDNNGGFTSDTVEAKKVVKNNVAVAQFFLDTAGFHGMNEDLVSTGVINSGYQYTVARVKKILVETTWPTELNANAQQFIENLSLFYNALSENKADEAAILSATVHDDQHALSHDIDHWAEETVETEVEANQFFISATQYILDSAGFHGMEDSLKAEQTINSSFNSTVKRVKKVLSHTVWPTELNADAQALIVNLGDFSTALAANNVADAIVFAETVHEAQHDLSSAIDTWVKSLTPANLKVNVFSVSASQVFLDAAGFHGMDESLTETKAIDPSFNSIVKRAKKVLSQTVWPTELNSKAQGLIKTLGLFSDALAANNVDDAIKYGSKVHEDQHELSHLIDEWLSTH